MQYLKFVIQNFKGIRRAEINLDADKTNVITIVGLNESGKTTVLEAISHFQYGAEEFSSLFELGDELEDIVPIAYRANYNGKVSIEAHVKLESEDVKAVRQALADTGLRNISFNHDDLIVREEYTFVDSRYESTHRIWNLSLKAQSGSQRSPRTYGAQTKEWQGAVQAIATRMMPIRYFPSSLFEFPDKIYLQPQEKSTEEKFYRDLLQGIILALKIGANLDDHLVKRANSVDSRDKDNLDSLLLAMGREVTSTVFGAWSEIFRRKVSDKSVVVSLGTDDDDRDYVRLRIQDRDGFFAISERSLGFRWFFVYLLLTSYTGAASQQVLFMFDEPASNLHPTAQQELLEGLGRLSGTHRVIFTTHSQHLVNPDWLESALVVRNAGLLR